MQVSILKYLTPEVSDVSSWLGPFVSTFIAALDCQSPNSFAAVTCFYNELENLPSICPRV